MALKLHFQYALSGLLALCSMSEVAAQQPTWKALRQQGANFYEIQDSFERQNAALLQAFQMATPRHEGDSAGKFNSIIKYNRWAHRVKARVTESQGDLSAITAGNARALAQRATEVQSRTCTTETFSCRNAKTAYRRASTRCFVIPLGILRFVIPLGILRLVIPQDS